MLLDATTEWNMYTGTVFASRSFTRIGRTLGTSRAQFAISKCPLRRALLLFLERGFGQSIVAAPPPLAQRGPIIPGGSTPDLQAAYEDTAGSPMNPLPLSHLQSVHNSCCVHRGGCELATMGCVAQGVMIEFVWYFVCRHWRC